MPYAEVVRAQYVCKGVYGEAKAGFRSPAHTRARRYTHPRITRAYSQTPPPGFLTPFNRYHCAIACAVCMRCRDSMRGV